MYDVLNATGNPQGTDPAHEWVELFNGTNAGIDLGGYFVHDASSADVLPSVTLPAGAFAVITGTSTLANFWNIPQGAVLIVLSNPTIGNGLANGGDTVWLESAASTTVDAVSWGTNTSAFSPSVTPAPDGSSIVRSSMVDTGSAADWIADDTPTPGQ